MCTERSLTGRPIVDCVSLAILSFTTTRFDSDPDNGSLTLQKKFAAAGVAGLPLFKIALGLVRLGTQAQYPNEGARNYDEGS
jgi:hypothetical protein